MSNPATLKPGDPDFGQRMNELRAERGSWRGGRVPVAQRHREVIRSVEDRIAEGLTDVFDQYIRELSSIEPEQCSTHKLTLVCPDCGKPSERLRYNHTAAQYLLDRLAGRPTSRSESAITIKLSQQLITLFVEAFQAVNDLQDATERQIAYADHVEAIEAQYTSQ